MATDETADRRRPERQAPKVDGRRTSDPSLTTSDCAELLGGGLTPEYILGEIHAGRLIAHTITRPGKRTQYQVSQVDFEAYQKQYGWIRDANTG